MPLNKPSAPTFSPTSEQLAILEAAQSTKDNLLLSALAGAAKTTTLVLLAQKLRKEPILSIAFNKSIAVEMEKRLPSHCSSSTLNSLGHRAWQAGISPRLTLDTKKIGGIVTEALGGRRPDGDDWLDCVNLARRARTAGYVPESHAVEGLCSKADLQLDLRDEDYSELAWGMLDEILTTSIRRSYKGLIDFDDQIYMPTLFGATWPRFPLTMVDEAQDLSPLNHALLRRLVGQRRLIAVGDRFQSIYGFRGAASNGMDTLAASFGMRELTLSISFRCPISVVKAARVRAPGMQWAPAAETGKVETLAEWSESSVPDHATILCRNNAPLVQTALRFLRAGRGVDLKSFDISKRLISWIEDLGPPDTPSAEGLRLVDRWRSAKLAEGKISEDTIADRASCMAVFIEATPDLAGAVKRAKQVFASEGPIKLMSVHKSKGLEFDNVFVLDPQLMGMFARTPAQREQEDNLAYVAITRAKKTLTYLYADAFVEGD